MHVSPTCPVYSFPYSIWHNRHENSLSLFKGMVAMHAGKIPSQVQIPSAKSLLPTYMLSLFQLQVCHHIKLKGVKILTHFFPAHKLHISVAHLSFCCALIADLSTCSCPDSLTTCLSQARNLFRSSLS